MPLQKPPSPEDIRKLHAEINQLVNQRFVLTTFAVTVFGVVTAWLIPKGDQSVGTFTYIGAALLLVLLWLLFLLSNFLKGMMRVYSVYLRHCNASGWEQDWYNYRKQNRYAGYTKPQGVLFVLLGAAAFSLPLILEWIFSQQVDWSRQRICFLTVVGIVYEVTVIIKTFTKWRDPEKRIKENWAKLDTDEGKA